MRTSRQETIDLLFSAVLKLPASFAELTAQQFSETYEFLSGIPAQAHGTEVRNGEPIPVRDAKFAQSLLNCSVGSSVDTRVTRILVATHTPSYSAFSTS
jgi:ATP-dependent phosphoenolpyruvate carboxykinase